MLNIFINIELYPDLLRCVSCSTKINYIDNYFGYICNGDVIIHVQECYLLKFCCLAIVNDLVRVFI